VKGDKNQKGATHVGLYRIGVGTLSELWNIKMLKMVSKFKALALTAEDN